MARKACAAKGQFYTAPRTVIVEEYLPCLQAFGQPHLTCTIAAPDGGDEAIVGAICDCDGFFFIVKRDDNLHWSKDLILRQNMLCGDPGKEGWGNICTALRRIRDDLPLCCLLYTSPSPRDQRGSRMPSSA